MKWTSRSNKYYFQDDVAFKKPASVRDIEDMGSSSGSSSPRVTISNKRKRTSDDHSQSQDESQLDGSQSWRDVLGTPPSQGTTKVGAVEKWVLMHVRKVSSQFSLFGPGRHFPILWYCLFVWTSQANPGRHLTHMH
ncbi:hypothetical protein DPMN_079684 [Dreissena polymorpha]|uniref:Uncharacterized protein n=1 Tax=Dreissena polymorpha TaxID=45954 RepID=A0A9D4BIK3_DREPO|nr:hypothetical protein DPMN_079684 [Dreissena polymorpha]